MKFLCPNCKAKYQISDEKIAGRTLKMDCRRCNHPIVIRGDKSASKEAASRSSRPSASSPSGRRRGSSVGGSGVGPAPSRSSRSALGADFRKNAGQAPAAQKPTALDQWYVAINDVPVGPMKRGEIANKIAAGAILGSSLSWREGFDDWRELKNIPELAALLTKARPAPPKPAFPTPGRGLGNRGPARPARPPSSARSQPTRPLGGSESNRAAARGNVVPIGGRLGAAAAPALDDLPQNDFDDEPTRVGAAVDFEAMEREAREQEEAERQARERAAAEAAAADAAQQQAAQQAQQEEEARRKPAGVAFGGDSDVFDPFASQAGMGAAGSSPGAAPAPGLGPTPGAFHAPPAESPTAAAVPVERRRRAIPIGAWIAIAGAMAFGVALAVMVGSQLLRQPAQPAVAVNEPTAPTEPQGPAEPTLDTEVPETPPDEAEETPEGAPDEGGEEEGGEEAATEAPSTQRGGTTQRGGGTSRGTSSATPSSAGTGGTGGGAAATKRPDPRFDRFADDSAGPAPIGTPTRGVLDERRERSTSTLNADQIRSVVNRERAGVTRCYETAARQSGRAPAVRVDVDVTVGGSGTVTQARARGQAFGNLHECIERSVRRWRFPSSGGQTQTSIPFVFQGRE
ncbi:MAG: hypothetical protein SangKO_090840 [Sandaracinaceae bacterium]